MKSTFIAITLSIAIAFPSVAQYSGEHSAFVLTTPGDAAYAVTHNGLDSSQLARIAIVPTHTLNSGVGWAQSITYNVFYPSSSYTTYGDVTYEGANAQEPVTITSSGGCTSYLYSWTAYGFSTLSEALGFYDGTGNGQHGHLNSMQRSTARLMAEPTTPLSSDRYVVLFQLYEPCLQ